MDPGALLRSEEPTATRVGVNICLLKGLQVIRIGKGRPY
jgi:hypothetical protein